jgi:integrase
MDAEPRLLERVRAKIRAKHYSLRTEHAYLAWIRRFIVFNDKKHPAQMSAPEVERFLSHLAIEGRVAAATQNQALAAILFLYRDVLELDLPWIENVTRARMPTRVPVVLSKADVQRLLDQLGGELLLIAQLLYGSGLRLMEALRLRVKTSAGARIRRRRSPGRSRAEISARSARVARLREQRRSAHAARRSPLIRRCPCSSVTSLASPSVKPKHEISRSASSPRAAPVIACS